MTDWLATLHSLYPNGLYYKDLSNQDLNAIEWPTLAAVNEPILLHVSTEKLPRVLEALVAAGLGPATECAFLAESVVHGTLGDISIKARSNNSGFLFLALDLLPLKQRLPLCGKSILVTRAARQSDDLAQLLRSKGARVVEVPAIEIALLRENFPAMSVALQQIHRYSWLILTSVNTVTILDDFLRNNGWNWALFDRLQIACIGKATAEAVRKLKGKVALVPPQFQAESLVEELKKTGIEDKKILLPRAAGSRKILPESLKAEGAIVDEIHLYRAELAAESRSKMRPILQQQIDFVSFTSSSTVHHFLELAKEAHFDFTKTRIACIGPITAGTLREYGLEPDIEAREFTMQGLVDAIVAAT